MKTLIIENQSVEMEKLIMSTLANNEYSSKINIICNHNINEEDNKNKSNDLILTLTKEDNIVIDSHSGKVTKQELLDFISLDLYNLSSEELVAEINKFTIPAKSLKEAIDKIKYRDCWKYLDDSFTTNSFSEVGIDDLNIYNDNNNKLVACNDEYYIKDLNKD